MLAPSGGDGAEPLRRDDHGCGDFRRRFLGKAGRHQAGCVESATFVIGDGTTVQVENALVLPDVACGASLTYS